MESRHGKTVEGAQISASSLRTEQHWPQIVVGSSSRTNGGSCDRRALLEFDVLELPEALLCSKSPYSKNNRQPTELAPVTAKKCRDPSYTGDPSHRTADRKRYSTDQHRNFTVEMSQTNCHSILTVLLPGPPT